MPIINPSTDYNPLLLSADNHNLANGDSPWYDSVANAPKFVAVAAASGVNSLINSGKAIGNFLGGDFQETDTEDLIREYDDDLANYYSDVKPYADVAGFVATSFIPGGLGVKLYKAGSKALWAAKGGRFGISTAEATGLMAPFREKYLSAAIKELKDAPSLAKLTNANYLKAVGAGVAENALQGMAFEAAVAATMFKSPTLDQMDISDMASNAMWSVALGGAIGGAVDAATGYAKIRNAIKAYDPKLNQYRMIQDVPESAPVFYKVRNYAKQHLEEFNPDTIPEGIDPKLAEREFTVRKQKLELKVIEATKQLTNGDAELANIVGHNLLGAKKLEDLDAALLKLDNISRVADDLEAGKDLIVGAAKTRANKQAATLFVNSVDGTVDETLIPRLGDYLKKGEKMTFSEAGVQAGSQFYKATDDIITAATPALQAEANWLHALNAPEGKYEFNLLGTKPISADNLPKLERAQKFFDSLPTSTVQVATREGETLSFNSAADLRKFIDRRKFELVEELKTTGMDFREISQRLNVSRKFAEDPATALMSYAEDKDIVKHLQYMENAGRVTDTNLVTNPFTKPTAYKLTYATDLQNFSKERVQAEVYYRSIDKELQNKAIALANTLDNGNQFPEIGVQRILEEASRVGSGAGTFTFANGEYLSLEGTMEYIGKLTADEMIRKGAAVTDDFQPILQAIKGDKESLLELNIFDAKIRSTPNKYAHLPEQKVMYDWSLRDAVEAMQAQDGIVDFAYLQKVAKGEVMDKDLHKLIDFSKRRDNAAEWVMDIKSDNLNTFISKHIKNNDIKLGTTYEVAKQRGVGMADFRGTYYAPPIDPTRYPHFALVRDASYGGGGSVGYLFAPNAQQLEEMIARVPVEDGFQVLTKSDIKNFKQALGEYRYDLSINENKVNSMLYRKGLLKPYAPATDSTKTLDEYLSYHVRSAEQGVREIVDNRYSAEFRTLRNMAKEQQNAESSVWATTFNRMVNSTNPYEDYVKTALNVSRKSEFPLTTISTFLEDKVDGVWNKMKIAKARAKSADELEALNKVMKENGLGEPYTDAMMEIFANTSYDRGILRKAVAKVNNVMSSVMLGMDSINALNNVIGSAVLQSSEIQYLKKFLGTQFDDLAKIKVPGSDVMMTSPAKLQAMAIKDFWSDAGQEALKRYKAEGIIQDDLYRMKTMVMDAAFTGSETTAEIGKRADAMFDKARQLTGNKLGEELTRFVSANIIERMTNPLVAAGKLTEKQALQMRNTFVNRVNGNYLASQRPMITQSAVGQATTLFLTYQANLMQQMFKYVANGDKRATLTLLGTQGLLYGMQGLPGFDLVNRKIALASGNTGNQDIHQFVQGTVGDEAYEWLMYGLGSNALGVISPELKFNLYSRGDINPRNPTIISLDPMQVPSVAITAKAVNSVMETFNTIDKGGTVSESVLQGIEHLGINRPLAGLAAAINGRSTTNQSGAMISAIDWSELGTYIRIAGAKPLNEAMGLDWYYRQKVIDAHQSERKVDLGKAIKTAYANGGSPTEDQMQTFMEEFEKAGGDISKFNRFMIDNMKASDESIFADSKKMLRSDYAMYLQRKMGGGLYQDYVDSGFETPLDQQIAETEAEQQQQQAQEQQ